MENLALRFMCSFRHLDHHLGENNDDLLMAGQDTLYGGSGNDILEGGTGDDNLYGGAGHDTHIWNEGDGVDHITDSDGQGHIEIRQADGSTRIVGGQFIKQNDGSYKSADDQITLRQNGGWSLMVAANNTQWRAAI